MQNKQSFKQKIFRLHASVGILFALFMYVSVFFGIFAILLPYIQVWEKPSRHFEVLDNTKINYTPMIEEVFKDPDFPKNNVIITLPGVMQDPALKISHRFVDPILFNPITKKRLKAEGKRSHLASFLNEMHYGRPLDFKKEDFGIVFTILGRALFGFIAVGIMVVVLSGLLLIIFMNFKNNGKTPKAFFSRYHSRVFTYTFPIFLIITLGGAFLNIGLLTSTPMAKMLSSGEKNLDALVGPTLFPKSKPVKKVNIEVKMLKINDLLKKARNINKDIIFQEIKLINWKDKSAQVEFKGYNPYKPFLNGVFFNKPQVILSAYDSSLIKSIKVMDRPWGVYVAEATLFLHFLFSVDIVTRLFIVLIMIVSGLAIAAAVMLYLEKKAKKFKNEIVFYDWMEKISLSVMVGVIPATGVLFNLQWLIPFELEDRVALQQALFFNTWLFTLFISFMYINTYKTAKLFLSYGGILFILAPILHYISLNINPVYLFLNDMGNILFIDVSLFIFGLILIYLSYKLPKDRDNAKYFWTKKEKNNEKIL